IERRGRRDVRRIDPPIAIGTRLRNARMNPARPSVVKIGGVAILIALLTLPTATIAPVPAWAQARSMDQRYSRDELAGDRTLRQLQQEQPQLFDQILNDINHDANARNPTSPDDLAASSPALEDLNRSSPEALLGLFLLLKGASKQGQGKQ